MGEVRVDLLLAPPNTRNVWCCYYPLPMQKWVEVRVRLCCDPIPIHVMCRVVPAVFLLPYPRQMRGEKYFIL